jgi:DNA uptake protein ComE-like DNA-binding protein
MPVVSEEQRIKIETQRTSSLIQQEGTEVKQQANEQVKTIHEAVIEGVQEIESKCTVQMSKVQERININKASAEGLKCQTYSNLMKNNLKKCEESFNHDHPLPQIN